MSATKSSENRLRLRVFAGPNGSGKSTVIQYIRDQKVNGQPIDFGIYVNADDIARDLKEERFSFDDYDIQTNGNEFNKVVLESGLISAEFDEAAFKKSYVLKENNLKLRDAGADERLAQIIADFLRKKLVLENKKFSFETVFSHSSKLDIMRQAASRGYKVYLYFVSTESPHINAYRVLARKTKGGHDVPNEKIFSRYYRSLELLFEASQIAYHAYYFDNSEEGTKFKMFAHFERADNKMKWDKRNKKNDPIWFKKYYSVKESNKAL